MKIKEVHILTDDLKKTEDFYSQLLGFRIIEKDSQHISFSVNQTMLHFSFTKSVKNPVYHLAFDIPNNKFEEAFNWLGTKTEILPVNQDSKIADFVRWNAKSFYFYDFQGNILEFITRYDNQINSTSAFNASSVLSVSEIGFVTDNVNNTCAEIIEKYGLQFYEKQPPLSDFAVIGDSKGLFIVVERNRNWYPTNKKSSSFYTKVIFEDKGQLQKIELT